MCPPLLRPHSVSSDATAPCKPVKLLGDTYSTRDASAHFESLRAPVVLQPVFGRRCVTVQELMTTTSLPLEEIRRYVVDGPNSVTVDMRVLPASAVLPMGWFLLELVCCESCTWQVAKNLGIESDSILSLEGEAPKVQSELCAVAADDVLLMMSSSFKINFVQSGRCLERR